MTPHQKLQEALGAGYRSAVLNQGSMVDAFAIFNRIATDPDVMEAAKAELRRGHAMGERCFVSGANANFLKQAIAQFLPVEQTPLPANTFTTETQGREDMTINSVSSEIEDSASALEDFANQVTNGGPPL